VAAGGAAILIGGPTTLAFFSGGFFDDARLVGGLVAWSLVVVAALVAERPFPTTTAGRLALVALALWCVWVALSLIWAPLAGRAQDDLQRDVLYLGYFAAALALLRAAWIRRALEPLLALGVLVVVGYGLSERLLPGLITLDRSQTADGRLEQPLTYWNALGALAAIGLVLSMRVAGDPRRPREIRAAAAAGGVPIALGLYLTFSRGALAAAATGTLVLLALAPAGRPQFRSVVIVLSAGAVAALMGNSLSTVRSLGVGEKGDASQGLLMLGALLVLGLAAAALQWVVSRGEGRVSWSPLLAFPRRAALVAGAVAIVVAGAGVATALEGKPEGESPALTTGPARFGSIDSNRYRFWKVALRSFEHHPILGVGSGGFFVEWRKEPRRVDQSADAHSLYIETLGELGGVGFVLLALFLGGVAMSARRLYRREPAVAAGVIAALTAWVIHAGLDWDWEMPALTLVSLALAAAAVAGNESPKPPDPSAALRDRVDARRDEPAASPARRPRPAIPQRTELPPERA
jgi:hypothetical protein